MTAIFKTFGELSAVRLPRKMAGTGDHRFKNLFTFPHQPVDFRGFAFVEFNALSDAKAAFKSLVHSTHLYGRRLVVEFASGDSSLEEMRSKTRKQWESGWLRFCEENLNLSSVSHVSHSHQEEVEERSRSRSRSERATRRPWKMNKFLDNFSKILSKCSQFHS